MFFAIILKSSKAHHFDMKSNVLYGTRWPVNKNRHLCVQQWPGMPRYSDKIYEWYVTIVSPSARVHYIADFKSISYTFYEKDTIF